MDRAKALEKILLRHQNGGEGEDADGLDAASLALLDRSHVLLQNQDGSSDSAAPLPAGEEPSEAGSVRPWEAGFDTALEKVMHDLSLSEGQVREQTAALQLRLEQAEQARELLARELAECQELRRQAQEEAAQTAHRLETERTKLWLAINELDGEAKRRELELQQAKQDTRAAQEDAKQARADLHVVNQQCVMLRQELYALDHKLMMHQRRPSWRDHPPAHAHSHGHIPTTPPRLDPRSPSVRPKPVMPDFGEHAALEANPTSAVEHTNETVLSYMALSNQAPLAHLASSTSARPRSPAAVQSSQPVSHAHRLCDLYRWNPSPERPRQGPKSTAPADQALTPEIKPAPPRRVWR